MNLKVKSHRRPRRALIPALKYFLRSEPCITGEKKLTNSELRELVEMLKFTTTMFIITVGILFAFLGICGFIIGGRA